jgi:hypothetical protein
MKHLRQLIGCFLFIALLANFVSCVKNIGQLPFNYQVNPGVLSLCELPETLTYFGAMSTSSQLGPIPITLSPSAAAGALGVAMFADQSLTDSAVIPYVQATNGFELDRLSQARTGVGAGSVDNLIFFAGGQLPALPGAFGNGFSSLVDIYDASYGLLPQSKASLSVPRALPAVGSAGHVIAFGGGIIVGDPYANSNAVDIYNHANNTWSASQLSTSRAFLAAAGWGTKILFGGGVDITSTIPTDVVDIYDINAKTWTVSKLSQARSHLAAAATCNKIFFAGGVLANAMASDRVDIYDVPSGTWTTAQLSEPRIDLCAVAAGNRIFLGGGYKDIALNPSTTVDVYDMSSGTWSTSPLSGKRVSGAAALNKVVFIGDTTADIFTLGQ